MTALRNLRPGTRLSWPEGDLSREVLRELLSLPESIDVLLTSGEPPTGTTRLSDWLAENGDGLGRRYVSELRRNYRG